MTVWDNDTTDEGNTYMDGLIAQFEAAHAGVAVQVQRIQNEDFDGRLLTNAAEHPDRVVLQPNPTVRLDPHGNLRLDLSPLSWTAVALTR